METGEVLVSIAVGPCSVAPVSGTVHTLQLYTMPTTRAGLGLTKDTRYPSVKLCIGMMDGKMDYFSAVTLHVMKVWECQPVLKPFIKEMNPHVSCMYGQLWIRPR